jgi:hypothetical protein
MLYFIIFFIIFSFFLKKISSKINFFEKIMNEMIENLKKNQQYFHNYSNYHAHNNTTNDSHSQSFYNNSPNSMSEKEALEILGLKDSASDEEIKAKYRLLILKFHPDSGGSEYLSRKLTDARNILLKK